MFGNVGSHGLDGLRIVSKIMYKNCVFCPFSLNSEGLVGAHIAFVNVVFPFVYIDMQI